MNDPVGIASCPVPCAEPHHKRTPAPPQLRKKIGIEIAMRRSRVQSMAASEDADADRDAVGAGAAAAPQRQRAASAAAAAARSDAAAAQPHIHLDDLVDEAAEAVSCGVCKATVLQARRLRPIKGAQFPP